MIPAFTGIAASDGSLASFSVAKLNSKKRTMLTTGTPSTHNESFPSSYGVSSSSMAMAVTTGPLHKKRRFGEATTSTTTSSSVSPSEYVASALKSFDIPSKLDPYSVMAATYFLPYTEQDGMDLQVLSAVRKQDKDRLRELLLQQETQHTRNEPRNQFGETLAHLLSRWGDLDMLTFLVKDLNAISLNVRDCHGRTPLHNACMAIRPNMDLIAAIVKEAPELLLYPDDADNLPLELVRCNYHSECIKRLSQTKSTWMVELLSRRRYFGASD